LCSQVVTCMEHLQKQVQNVQHVSHKSYFTYEIHIQAVTKQIPQ
jgi:hypothetical protein